MKQIKKFGIIALFAVVAFGLFSCKNEDDNSSSDDTTPPADVTNFSVDKIDGKYILSWTDATDSDIFGYEITYSELTETVARTVMPMESGSIFVAKGMQRCEMSPLDTGKVFNFTVKTMDLSGNKSAGVSFKTTVLTKEECQLWTQVFYNNVQYDVVKNSFITTTATEPTEAQKAKLSPRYDRNDTFRDGKIKEDLGIEDCIILLEKVEPISSDGKTRYDRYRVLNENLERIATVEFLFEYSNMDISSEVPDTTTFKNLSAKELREKYNPTRIDLRNEPAAYGTDYSKMVKTNYRYYATKGKTNFESTRNKNIYKDPIAKGDTASFLYGHYIGYNTDGSNKEENYGLQEIKKGSHGFANIGVKPNHKNEYVRATGDGQLNGSTDEKKYKVYTYLKSINLSSIYFSLEFRKTVDGTEKRQTYNIGYNYKTETISYVSKQNREGDTKSTSTSVNCTTWDEFNALTTDDFIYEGISFKDTIVFSEEKDSNGLPKVITLTAPFRDRNAPYQKYATATFNLSETETYPNSNIPLYVADVDGFLNKYRTDYLKLYQDYKAANP